MRHARRTVRPTTAPPALRAVGAVGRTVAAVVASAALTVVAGLAVWSVLPTVAGWRADVVMSGSMEPAIRAGDLVLSEPMTAVQLRPGQVALFRSQGRTLVHRVQEVTEDGSLVTRGDANRDPDLGAVTPDDVLGLARLRVPFIGLPALWWHRQAWLPLSMTALACVLAVAVVSTEDERRTGRHVARATA